MPGMRFLAALLCTSVLSAQPKSDPLSYVPPDADAVIQLAGPAVWRRDFGPTSLGKALADPQLTPIWEKFLAALCDGRLLGGVADSEQRQRIMRELWEQLQGYSGRIVLAGCADWEAISDFDQLTGAACIVLGGDGATDLAALAKSMADALPGERVGEVEVGGVPAELRSHEGSQTLGPVMHDGNLVLLIGQELEERALQFFEERDEPAEWSQLRGHTFSSVFRMEGAIAPFLKVMDLESRFPDWFAEEMGLLALKEFGFSARPDGKYVAQQTWATLNEKQRGLIGVLYPPRATEPTLLQYLPAGAGNYTACPFDVDEIVRIYEHIFATYADDLPMDRTQLEQAFHKMTKLDLLKDVVAHVGNEYLRIEDIMGDAEYDEDDPVEVDALRQQLGDTCLVVKLRNGRALAKSLDTAIRARGLHVGRKREKYNGTTIYRMNLLGMFPIEYAVTDSLLVLGVGSSEGAKRNFRGVLDSYAAVVAGGDPPTLVETVQERIDRMPKGWGGMDAISLVELVESVVAAGEETKTIMADEGLATEDLDDPWALLFEAGNALQGVVKRHGIAMAVNLMYFEKGRYLIRSRW